MLAHPVTFIGIAMFVLATFVFLLMRSMVALVTDKMSLAMFLLPL